MERYVVDTHALLWHITADSRIGAEAKALIDKCEAGEIQIIVPAIVLIEAISALRNPRKNLNYDAGLFLNLLQNNKNFLIHDLTIETASSFNDHLNGLLSLHDDHDRLVVITSRIFDNIPIITRAEDIKSIAPTVW
jgi:PIN domain.